jgi:aryl-alcohol dehydrogenase-like predicted oxidoreductase
MLETEWRPESLVIAQKIKAHAEARGTTAGRFSFAWLLNNRIVSSVLAGPRTFEQWDDYVAALDYDFTAEDEAFMSGLVPAGHPSTYGYTDPRYPLEGRPVWTGDE